jgi:hypothetical protein
MHVQRLVSVVKMATVLEEFTAGWQHSIVRFSLWAKGLSAKDIHKEICYIYGGKCLLHKAVHSWVRKFSQRHSKVADDAFPSAEVAETIVK